MEVKVLKRFKDKSLGIIYAANSRITMSEDRFDEINGTPAGKLVEKIKEDTAKEKKKKE